MLFNPCRLLGKTVDPLAWPCGSLRRDNPVAPSPGRGSRRWAGSPAPGAPEAGSARTGGGYRGITDMARGSGAAPAARWAIASRPPLPNSDRLPPHVTSPGTPPLDASIICIAKPRGDDTCHAITEYVVKTRLGWHFSTGVLTHSVMAPAASQPEECLPRCRMPGASSNPLRLDANEPFLQGCWRRWRKELAL